MTAPAEDPRGGEGCSIACDDECEQTCHSVHHPWPKKDHAPQDCPAAGRGDTDRVGCDEGGSEPLPPADLSQFTARPAGDRAQPAQELREAIRDEIAGWSLGSGYFQYTVTTEDAGELADALIAGPLAALLAKLLAVEELVDELMTERSLVPDIARRAAADRIRRALGGPS